MNPQVFKELRFILVGNRIRFKFSNSNKLSTGIINVMNKKIYQSIFSLFIAFMAVMEAKASDITLVVWTKSGTQIGYVLDRKPKITFTETQMIITGDGIDAIYDLNNFLRYTYSIGDETGVRNIRTEKTIAKLDGESLLFPSLQANSTVSVHILDGTLVFKKTVHEEGKYALPLSLLGVGVYIVNVNGITYKIVKK